MVQCTPIAAGIAIPQTDGCDGHPRRRTQRSWPVAHLEQLIDGQRRLSYGGVSETEHVARHRVAGGLLHGALEQSHRIGVLSQRVMDLRQLNQRLLSPCLDGEGGMEQLLGLTVVTGTEPAGAQPIEEPKQTSIHAVHGVRLPRQRDSLAEVGSLAPMDVPKVGCAGLGEALEYLPCASLHAPAGEQVVDSVRQLGNHRNDDTVVVGQVATDHRRVSALVPLDGGHELYRLAIALEAAGDGRSTTTDRPEPLQSDEHLPYGDRGLAHVDAADVG